MEILTYPHPLLRFKTKELKIVDQNIKTCAAAMVEAMHAEKGQGLSANQLGWPFRMFVLHHQDRDVCFINPTIHSYGKLVTKDEGCLSFPDLTIPVKRRAKCHFHAWDIRGDEVNEEVSGDLCRALQHEMDHLDGILFIDRTTQTTDIKSELDLMKKDWEEKPQEFSEEIFNGLLYDYCGVPPN